MFIADSNIIVAVLAVFGMLCLGHELWLYIVERRYRYAPSVSIVLAVKNIERDIEYVLRQLVENCETRSRDYDIVVLDCDSADLTYAIAQRLSRESDYLRAVPATRLSRDLASVLPHCRGEIIHVIDAVDRVERERLVDCVNKLLA